MKKLFLTLILFFVALFSLSPAFAQYEPSTQFRLPDGAIARLDKGSIKGIMYSPDGTQFAVTTEIGVWIYDAQTGEELDLIAGKHKDRVYAAAYSPDSKTIATVGEDKTIQLWNVHTGQHLKTLNGHKDEVNSVAFSPHGQILATGSSDNTIRLWNTNKGKCIKILKRQTQAPSTVQFSPDGEILTSTCGNDTIRFWDVNRGQLINKVQEYQDSISYSPDGKTLLVVANDDGGSWLLTSKDSDGKTHKEIIPNMTLDTIYAVHMLNIVTGQRIKSISSLNYVDCFAYSPDGKTIAIGEGNRFGLWDAVTGKHLKTLIEDTSGVSLIAFSPDGKTIATVSWDGTMRWWNVQTGKNIKTFPRSIDNYGAISFSPDGKTIAISEGRELSLCNAESGKYLTTIQGHKNNISGFVFSLDSKTIATGSNDGTARLWDSHTGKNKKILVEHTNHINQSVRIDMPVYSPDGKSLAARSKEDNWVWLWDAHTGEIIIEIQGERNTYKHFVYSPDGKMLATKNRKQPVQIWNTITGKNINTLIGPLIAHAWDIAFSPDGKTIVTYTRDMVQLWDTITGENINTLFAPDAFDTIVLHLHGKPFAITTYEHKTSSLWDVTSGQLIKNFKIPGDDFSKFFGWLPREKISFINYEIQCSPIGDTFVTIADHTPVRLWNITTGKLIGKPIKHLKGEDGYISVMYSPDGKTIATIPVGDDFQGGTVRLWDVATGEHLKTLKGYSNSDYNSVAYSPDSKTIATGHQDGTVLLWDIPQR